MKNKSLNIRQIALPILTLSMMFFVAPAAADSIIRLIGDRTTKSSNSSSGPTAAELPPSSVGGSNTIRIIGDKVETVQKKSSEQMTVIEVNEKDLNTKSTAEEATPPKETAEQLLAKRLAALKAAEQRKTAEKRELQKLAQAKAEQEKAAAEALRLAAIEQEQLAFRKAAEKAEQERLAAERRTKAEKVRPEKDASARQSGLVGPHADSQTDSRSDLDIILNQDLMIDNKSGAVPETIWDLYLSAKANDPALGRTEARVTASKADSDVLLSGLLPHLDTNAGVQQIYQTLTNYTPNDINNDYTSFNYGVTARMTLLNVPTIYSMSAAAAGLSGEQAGVAAARQNLIVKFTDSYFSLLKAQTDKQISLGEINRLKQVLNQSHAFLKEGMGDVIAVYEAQSRLDGAVADLTKSESNLRLAEQKLSTVVGKPVTSIMNYLPQQPIGPEPDSLDWWVATMEKEQPLVRQAREGVAQTSEQRKAVKAEYLPILQASGGYDVNRGTAALPTAEVKQWFVGASISLPLYSGGETSAKVRRAVASEEERRHLFDETMDQQRENVKQAFFNLRYNISYIKALEQKKASAEIQLAAVSKGRNIGTRNAIDLLNAEQGYSMALRDYKYALYDNVIRVIQLKSAAGILADADISEVSRAVGPILSSGLR